MELARELMRLDPEKRARLMAAVDAGERAGDVLDRLALASPAPE